MHWPLPSSRDGIGGKDRREEERTLVDEEWMAGGEGIIGGIGESMGGGRGKVKDEEKIWDKF